MTAVSSLATHVTAPVNFVLMRGLLTQARKVLPYFNGTLPGDLQKNGGSASVKWRRFEDLSVTTTALGEVTGNAAFGMGRTAVTPTITDITVAVAKYGNYINFSEELDLFNVNSRAAQLMDVLGRNAGESLNTLAANVYDASTNVRFANGVATSSLITTEVKLNDIRSVVNQLNRESAMKFFSMGTGSTNIGTSPVRASYYGICHSDVEDDIRGLSGFIPVEQYGGYVDDIQVGEFGAVAGVRFSSTPIAPTVTQSGNAGSANGMRGTGVNSNTIYKTFVYGQEAIGTVGLGEMHTEEIYMMGDRPSAIELIRKAVGSAGAGDPFNEVGTLAWKAWFAGKILNQRWIWEIDSYSVSL